MPLAGTLGTTVSDLLGAEEDIAEEVLAKVPRELRLLAREKGRKLGMRREDVEMLRHIHYRGRRLAGVGFEPTTFGL